MNSPESISLLVTLAVIAVLVFGYVFMNYFYLCRQIKIKEALYIAELERKNIQLEEAKLRNKELNERLKERTAQAFLNPVSGHPNLLGSKARIDDLFDRLERGIVGKVTLVYIDLDKFKPVNGEYGHHNGDKVIKIACKLLLHSVRHSDIVIHLSGDEYCILCADTEKEEIEAIMKRANTALAEYNFTFAKEGKVNTSYTYAFVESDKH